MPAKHAKGREKRTWKNWERFGERCRHFPVGGELLAAPPALQATPLQDCKRPKFTNQSFFCPFFALFRVFRGRPSPFSFRLSRAIRRTGSKGWSLGLRRPE
jgi:hypothetical protein